MEKIEIINVLLSEFGLTPQDVAKNWITQGLLDSTVFTKEEKNSVQEPFEGINFVPSKKFVTPRTVEPGMFYYADGLIYPELIKGNQVSAIVASVEKNRGLAMGLREAVLPWSSDYLYVGMPDDIDGKEATERILIVAKKQGKKAEAAEWCAAYAFDGIEAGTMFMPGIKEWKKISAKCQKLWMPFAKLDLEGIENGKYWSSSEEYDYNAWEVRPSEGRMSMGYYKKTSTIPVRCVLDFKL